MKIYFIMLMLIAIGFSGCKKSQPECIASPLSVEASELAQFCTDNGINYTVDANGIYYQILTQGAGSFASNDSVITIAYTSNDLKGNTFNAVTADTPEKDFLYNFIEGWRLAIPYIQKGGHIKMVIPSSLCYGCSGSNAIPPNTPLYFDVYLIDVSN